MESDKKISSKQYFLDNLLYGLATLLICIILYFINKHICINGVIGILIRGIICCGFFNIIYYLLFSNSKLFKDSMNLIKRIVLKIKSGTSKFSIGSLVDGFLAGILIPFSLDLFKIITTSSPTKDLKGELLFYLACLIIAAILEIIKLCIKPKFLASYTTFNSDIENLNDRISEIDERLKIK